VNPNTATWAIGGVSNGGTCSLQMAVTAPDVYRTFLDISGEAEPTLGGHADTVAATFGGDEAAFAAVNPLDVLAARSFPGGIHPAALAQGGLGPALKGLARRSAVPVKLEVRVVGRLPEQFETAAYYVVSEALTNAAKHAHASVVHVGADTVEDNGDGVLRVRVTDDGRGGAHFAGGSGLVGLKDRVEALGGTLTIESPPGEGTALHATVLISGGLSMHSSS
jgi:signal transduction histidine kinase